ncbi:MAG: DUF1559 domain-containing protein [Phycisphaera sp.]|nr:DUF1559 domain-containing protein [Phycisphaera sp.]
MNRRRAFTIIELLVVLSIIVLLLAILLPSFWSAREVARRAVCASNQRQIGVASLSYTIDNHGGFLYCGNRKVQIAFFNVSPRLTGDRYTDVFKEWAARGMMHQQDGRGPYQPDNVWNCPSRDFESTNYDPPFSTQAVVGYQYYGGVFQWNNAVSGNLTACSPVVLSTSKSRWVLAADTACRIDYVWGGGRGSAYAGMPSHQQRNEIWPDGQSQLYVDGSVDWVQPADMVFVHSWGGRGNYSRVMFIAQDDLGGWTPPASLYIEAFK